MGTFNPAEFAALETLMLQARAVMEGFLHGLHKSPFHGPSVEFADYRQYQPGDDPRRLDWRLYARSDRLVIKRFEQEVSARARMIIDTSASMSYRGSRAWGAKLDAARILSTALAWLLLRQNDAVGLFAPGEAAQSSGSGDIRHLEPSQTPSQLGRFLGEVEALEARGEGRLPELLDRVAELVRRRGLIFLFTDLLDDPALFELPLRRLRFAGHEVILIQILDPDELDFPFTDGTVFEDLETGAERQLSGAAARTAYLDRFERFMAEHRALLRRLEISHLLVRTDEDPALALGRFLARHRLARRGLTGKP